MFTGIIRTVGTIRRRRRVAGGVSFAVACPGLETGVSPGDSVAVNGVCQTVENSERGEIVFTAVGETLKRTTLGLLRTGARVNLETAATAESLLGGHIVQGHVDGVGTVQSFVKAGKDRILKVRVPKDVLEFIVPKGSIAIDGVSLTVIERGKGGVVAVTVVPYTLEHTVVEAYRSGTRVNVETDILGKYANQRVEHGPSHESPR